MKRIFYIHDIQDIWLFGVLLVPGSTLIYNTQSQKSTSPSRFLDKLDNFNLIPFSGDYENLNSFIEKTDQFITKECLPYTSVYLSKHPQIRKQNQKKIISLGWIGESSDPGTVYHKAVYNNYKIHFCASPLVPIYNKMGFRHISCTEPKFTKLNELTRDKACSILGLNPTHKYATFLITSGGGASRHGFMKHLYSPKNRNLINFIKNYCADNNIKIILKNKRKHQKNREGLTGDFTFNGYNIFYHETLLLQSLSEFTIGFGSSSVLEAEYLGAPYVNFTPLTPTSSSVEEIHEYHLRDGLKLNSSLLARAPSSLNIYPSHTQEETSPLLLDFLKKSKAVDFTQRYPLHDIFKH